MILPNMNELILQFIMLDSYKMSSYSIIPSKSLNEVVFFSYTQFPLTIRLLPTNILFIC